jgi:cyclophilin family peptidyl-prolyl cis-trans isomerase
MKYVNPSSEAVISDTNKLNLKLVTNKGDIVVELDPTYGYYNVQNAYLFSKEKAYDGSNITFNTSTNTFNFTAKDTLKRVLPSEINFVSLKIGADKAKTLNDNKIYSDDSYLSKSFSKYSFGVKLDPTNLTRNEFIISNSDNKELDGYYVNIGRVVTGSEKLSAIANTKDKITINSSSISVKQ